MPLWLPGDQPTAERMAMATVVADCATHAEAATKPVLLAGAGTLTLPVMNKADWGDIAVFRVMGDGSRPDDAQFAAIIAHRGGQLWWV
jgi:hypothetical protein